MSSEKKYYEERLIAVKQKEALATEERKFLEKVLEGLNRPSRIWRVSDCHSYCRSGSWALEATESKTYGVCIGPNKTQNEEITLYNGEKTQVSRGRYTQHVKDIAINDVLYMADAKRKRIFKGVVTGQIGGGAFKSADSTVNSFRRRAQKRDENIRANSEYRNINEEIEIMWNVHWTEHAVLNDTWKRWLQFSKRATVVPLTYDNFPLELVK